MMGVAVISDEVAEKMRLIDVNETRFTKILKVLL